MSQSVTSAFLEHYVEYISAPGVLLTLLLLAAPLVYNAYNSSPSPSYGTQKASPIPGCRRFGLSAGQSNLKDQYSRNKPNRTATCRIKALFTYPIKSCHGIELPASELDSTGLKYDRMFTFAQLHSKQTSPGTVSEPSSDWQHEWRFITARELPRLALVKTELWVPDLRKPAPKPSPGHVRHISDDTPLGDRVRSRSRKGTVVLESAGIDADRDRRQSVPFIASDWRSNGGCLVISFPFEPDFNPLGLRTETVTIKVPLAPTLERAEAKGYTSEDVTVWKDCPQAMNITNEIPARDLEKLRYYLGVSKPLGLFRKDESHLRPVTRSLPEDLADGRFEFGFADSYPAHVLNVASVRALDASLPDDASMKNRLDARRFRANIYIEGPEAFEEDNWKRAAFGRCIQPRVDFSGERGRSSMQAAYGDQIKPSKAEFLFGCGTSRCTLPNVDPDTGIKDRNEPYKTLMRTRKTVPLEPKGAFLGMQILPLLEYGIISVGDEVEVMESELTQ
jgi:uncharacterized protein YcbX